MASCGPADAFEGSCGVPLTQKIAGCRRIPDQGRSQATTDLRTPWFFCACPCPGVPIVYIQACDTRRASLRGVSGHPAIGEMTENTGLYRHMPAFCSVSTGLTVENAETLLHTVCVKKGLAHHGALEKPSCEHI